MRAGEENQGGERVTQCCSQNWREEWGENGSRLNEGWCRCGNRQNVGLRWGKRVRGRWWEDKKTVGEKRECSEDVKISLSMREKEERQLSALLWMRSWAVISMIVNKGLCILQCWLTFRHLLTEERKSVREVRKWEMQRRKGKRGREYVEEEEQRGGVKLGCRTDKKKRKSGLMIICLSKPWIISNMSWKANDKLLLNISA